jgi:pimeloyl-ACP methyl ester carboxylesterase
MITIILASAIAAATATGLSALAYRKLQQRRIGRGLRITSPRALVEERFVRLGGIEQWIGLRGEDRANPLLLMLHGGPGFPYSPLSPRLRAWEKHFTVVQWDRRGVGKTLARNGKAGTGELTFTRMIDDGIELTEYLRARFGQEKIILLSSSMGTLVGLPMAQRRPELFAAYVGTDFNVSVLRNELRSHPQVLAQLLAAGDHKAVAALERMGGDPQRWSVGDWSLKQRLTAKTISDGPRFNELLLLPLLCEPGRSLRELWHTVQGLELSSAQLFGQFMTFDAWEVAPRLEVPFFMFQGEDDRFTLTELAEEYFRDVMAPAKRIALIGDAGHFAAFTQPEQFLAQLLAHVRPLAGLAATATGGGTAATATTTAAIAATTTAGIAATATAAKTTVGTAATTAGTPTATTAGTAATTTAAKVATTTAGTAAKTTATATAAKTTVGTVAAATATAGTPTATTATATAAKTTVGTVAAATATAGTPTATTAGTAAKTTAAIAATTAAGTPTATTAGTAAKTTAAIAAATIADTAAAATAGGGDSGNCGENGGEAGSAR